MRLTKRELVATNRNVRFPGTSADKWVSIFDDSDIRDGGTEATIEAPIETIPVYKRAHGASKTLDGFSF